MEPWFLAWALATISGLSLPIGAVLGIIFTPVRDEVCAAWMALGAGALLFAVTVELYGHALRELELGRAGLLELIATVIGALLGAFFYLAVNRWLERMMEDSMVEDLEDTSITSIKEPTENTPLNYTPVIPRHKDNSWSVSSALAEERKIWEQVSSPTTAGAPQLRGDAPFSRKSSPTAAGAPPLRDSSFSRMSSFGADSSDHHSSVRGRDKVINRITLKSQPASPAGSLAQVDPEMAQRGKQVAFALFLGILVDGVPEGLLMGFLAAEGHLSMVLVISLLVANFPEAFSSASLMRQGNVSSCRIVSMWGGLCLMVGLLAGSACFLLKHFFPTYPDGDDLPQSLMISVAIVEGITGGAMIACIATVMLPEAFHRAGKEGLLVFSSGFLCTAGFLVAVTMKALEHHYNNTHGSPDIMGHVFYLPGSFSF